MLLDGRSARMVAISERRAAARAALAAAAGTPDEDRLLKEMSKINVLDVTTYAGGWLSAPCRVGKRKEGGTLDGRKENTRCKRRFVT